MRIGRRHFVHAAALCAFPAAPAFAALRPARVPAPPHSPATDAPTVVFRIDGWEPYDVPAGDPDPGSAWIGVSRSWRANWR